MTEHLAGDGKCPRKFAAEYRLRVGDHRVLFDLEGQSIVIYRVLLRREAYR